MRLSEFFDRHAHPALAARGLADTTLRAYGSHARTFGAKNILKVTRKDIEAHIAAYLTAHGHSAAAKATANKKISTLHVLFAEAVYAGVLKTNPCEGVRPVKTPKPLPRSVPGDLGILAVCETQRERTVFVLLGLLGLRSAEALKVMAADFDGGFIRVVCGKGGKGRRFPVGEKAAALLAPAIAEGGRLLRGISYSTINRIVGDLSVRAGLPRMSPHQCRHSFATRAAEGGATLDNLAAVMGHASYNTTKRYLEGANRNLASVVDAASGGGT